ncbi:MAG: glycosyl hydrolase 53 family protein [Oscillospiraceae bacterium]|nr:glycosyl hydrolase 53 family protein [Oscillospiraceae bacterium]
MKIISKLTALVCAAGMIFGSFPNGLPAAVSAAEDVSFSGITGLPFPGGDPFKGVDISSVISLEQSGVVFRDRNGNPQDIFLTLADAGVNCVRIRVWNDPFHSSSGANYGGGICDVNCAVKIAERCANAGLKLLVDFHYSDFWADPGKQKAPKAWNGYSVSQKADAIYQFTLDSLKKIGAAGAEIAMVQVGNETTTGMCGVLLNDYDWSDEGWRNLASLFNAGARAVREFSQNTLVALHFTNPEKTSNMNYLAKMLHQTNVDYDVFATSYYPYWHGTLDNLKTVLTSVSQTYDKQVLVAETSWLRTLNDGDFFGNTISKESDIGNYVSYEVSPAGQTAYLHDLFSTVAAIPDGKGIGVFYWEPAWLPVGSSYQSNLNLWETFGSGWASKAAGEYDDSAVSYYGGSCVDNESLFSYDGVPLDSLYSFGSVHGDGNENVILGKNILSNPGFESDGGWTASPSGWTLRSTSGGHFDVRAEDPRSGDYALHWYSESAFSGSSAAASVKIPEAGTYRVQIHIQGDESSRYEMTVTSSGGRTERVTGSGSGWAVWQTTEADIDLQAGETVTVTLTVSGDAGCYGSVDDCSVRKITNQQTNPDVHFEETDLFVKPNHKRQIHADREGITYRSSDPEIAEVSDSGEVFAHKTGKAVITGFLNGKEVGQISVTVRLLKGDLNADGVSDAPDAVLLAAYLRTESNLSADAAEQADFDENGILNAIDLTLLKREIFQN